MSSHSERVGRVSRREAMGLVDDCMRDGSPFIMAWDGAQGVVFELPAHQRDVASAIVVRLRSELVGPDRGPVQ